MQWTEAGNKSIIESIKLGLSFPVCLIGNRFRGGELGFSTGWKDKEG